MALTVLRVGMGVVFLLFGIGKFQGDIWAQTIQAMDIFQRLPWSTDISVYMIGSAETAIGICLILGFLTRWASAAATVMLLGILVLLNFQEIRDIGLLSAALYLVLGKDDSFKIRPCLSCHGITNLKE